MTLIDDKIKSKAIAMLHKRTPVTQIAEELEISTVLVEEWAKKLDLNDLVAVQANINAVEQLTKGELVELESDELKKALEQSALDIAKMAPSPCDYGDIAQAKSINLCADAVSKLYQTIVLKGGMIQPQSGDNVPLSVFQSIMKD